MCIGGRCGAAIDVDGPGDADLWGRLWGESLGRIIVGVDSSKCAEFKEMMLGNEITYLGETTDSDTLRIYDADETIIESNVLEMTSVWKGALDMTGGNE